MTDQRHATDEDRSAALTIWDYHQMGHELRPAEAAIGLGCHDLGVATFAAALYRADMFPTVVFSGADNPIRAHEFPRGEATHFKERAMQHGVPESAILTEPQARNTGENIALSRELLLQAGVSPGSVLLICMPYMQRRAYATARKVWPEAEPICASAPCEFDEYVKLIGDEHMVISQLVGDLQRVMEYPKLGFAITQDVPTAVERAYDHLIAAGFRSRLMDI